MPFNERDLRAVESIVSVFETGRAHGNASAVAVLPDGAGLSFGLHQATDRSDALDKILKLYIERGGLLASALELYLPELAKNTRDSIRKLANDNRLKQMLRDAGGEPIMVQCQKDVFRSMYMNGSIRFCDMRGYTRPLSLAVVYDSNIQGSFQLVRERVSSTPDNEQAWISEYVTRRRYWLRNHRKAILRSTAYRPDTFLNLINANNWGLKTPFEVHGIEITEADLV